MTAAVFGSVLGTAALTVGRGAATALGNSLSFGAELLRAANGDNPAVPAASEKPVGGLASQLKQRIDDLAARIHRQLTAAGIQLTQPVELSSDGAGGIAVQSDHPQSAAIQEVLRSDFLLERDFQQLASDYEQMQTEHPTANLPLTLQLIVPAAQ